MFFDTRASRSCSEETKSFKRKNIGVSTGVGKDALESNVKSSRTKLTSDRPSEIWNDTHSAYFVNVTGKSD